MNKKQIKKLYSTLRESNEECDLYLIEKELEYLEGDIDLKKIIKYIVVIIICMSVGISFILMCLGLKYLIEMGVQ